MGVAFLKSICLGLQKCISEKASPNQRPTLLSRQSKTLMNSCLNFNEIGSIKMKFLSLKSISPFLQFPSILTCRHNFMEKRHWLLASYSKHLNFNLPVASNSIYKAFGVYSEIVQYTQSTQYTHFLSNSIIQSENKGAFNVKQ